MRARTARRAAEREARRTAELDQQAKIRDAMRLVEETFAAFGPPPDMHRIVLASNGSRIWIHEYTKICAELRATGDPDAIRCAAALEAIQVCPGSVRVLLADRDGRWHTARAVTMTAPGGDA